MPAPTLVSSCIKACIKNVRSIEDVGILEYMQCKPVLQRVESPEQLHQIEEASPQIKADTAELWQKFIARDIPNWHTKNYMPKNPTKWYEVYCKYRKEQRREIARDEEILRETMSGLKKKREENVSKIVELRTLPKVPRDPRMLANNGGVPLGKHKPGGKIAPSSLMWSAGSKTKMTDGRSVLTRARREAKEISQMSRLSKPTHQLGGRIGQVSKAPVAMVKEYKTAAQPQAVRILSRKRSNILSNTKTGNRLGSSFDLEEREERLRQAMKSKMSSGMGLKRDSEGQNKPTFVGSSDDDDESEGDSLGDIVDDQPYRTQSKPIAAASLTRAPKPLPPKSAKTKTSSSRPQANNPTSSYAIPLSSSKESSDLISSMIGSRPKSTSQPSGALKSAPRTKPLPSTMPSHRSSPASSSPSPSPPPPPRSRNESPEPGAQRRPMMMPKRKEVDIFNRRPKKPRVG